MSFDGITIAALAVIGLVWLIIECSEKSERLSAESALLLGISRSRSGLAGNDSDGGDAVDRMRAQRRKHGSTDHEVQDEDSQGEQRDREDEADDELRGRLFGGSGGSEHAQSLPTCTCGRVTINGWCYWCER